MAAPRDVSALKIEFNRQSLYDLVQCTRPNISAICTQPPTVLNARLWPEPYNQFTSSEISVQNAQMLQMQLDFSLTFHSQTKMVYLAEMKLFTYMENMLSCQWKQSGDPKEKEENSSQLRDFWPVNCTEIQEIKGWSCHPCSQNISFPSMTIFLCLIVPLSDPLLLLVLFANTSTFSGI